ncbi:hypothetical protein [Escherichia coli]|nr:hypothetical protein [Escherichia coli]
MSRRPVMPSLFCKKSGTSRKQVYKLVPPKQWLLWWGCHSGVWST